MHGYRGCIEKERRGLLELKAFLISVHPNAELVWTSNRKSNCCRWERIKCDVNSQRVIGLSLGDLVYAKLAPLNLSLFHPFGELQSLNLSRNSFGGWFDNLEGYKSLRRLPKLEILDLSKNSFNSSIFPFFHFATSLKTLILRRNYMEGDFHMEGYKSLLPKLEILDLAENGFNSSILPFFQFATSLKTLNLRGNYIEGDFPTKELNYLTSLEVLDLSGNYFNSTLPSQGLADLHKLKALDLSNNEFSGSAQGICKWRTLEELDISRNGFQGQLPPCFASFMMLRVLDLSSNYFDGNLPNFISSLASLEYLSLSDNNFEGLFSYSSFKNLSKLKVLKLSSMSDKLQIEMESSWRPEFQLRVLELRDCNLEKIPSFLWYQKDMRLVDLSNNKLAGPFPTWLLENNTRLEVLYLQYNSLHTLRLPKVVHNLRLLDLTANNFDDRLSDDFGRIFSSLRQINLSGNKFKGSLPASVGEMESLHSLDLSHNDFSGNLPRSLYMGCHFLKLLKLSHNRFDGQFLPESTNLTWLMGLLVDNNMFTGNIGNGLLNSSLLRRLDMSNNFLTGTIPSWMGEFLWTALLISNNLLEGTLPSTLFYSQSLYLVDFSRNNLSGSIPSNFSDVVESVGMLDLHDNFLTGPLPETLLEKVVVLDVRNNELSGSIPVSINASGISVLLLRGNNLTGPIPRQLCSLSRIRILDLAYNRLNESIPTCLRNLSFGLEDGEELDLLSGIIPYMDRDMGIYFESILELDQIDPDYMYGVNITVEIVAKQRYDSYFSSTLGYMFGLDLSNNELSGEIPQELGDLKKARSLNLSHNSLTGFIPESFSKMKDIESLDLSFNKFSGPIPVQLTELNSLAVFNVSYNNLSGVVPHGKQFNTFGENSYFGNPFLCGLPTKRSCDINSLKEPEEEKVDDETNIDAESFYWSLGVTYAAVLVGIFVFICFDSPWRRRWFRLVDASVRLIQNTCT